MYSIHSATVDVLQKTGVVIHEEEALKILEAAGSSVDYREHRARIPEKLIEEILRKTPHTFIMRARNTRYDLELGAGKSYYAIGAECLYVHDLQTQMRRRATIQDLEALTRLMDGLENVHRGSSGLVHPSDVDDNVSHAYVLKTLFENSEKIPGCNLHGKDEALDCIGMARIVAGGADELRKKRMIFGTVCPASPLQHDAKAIQGLLKFAEHGLPVNILTMTCLGSTGPSTIAGTLVQQNAEILSGIAIAQLVTPGTPVFYSVAPAITDMRTGISSQGRPEAFLIAAASAQLAKYYRIPCGLSNVTSDSKTLDEQTAYEKSMALFASALSGADIIAGAGVIEYFMTASYEQLVVDNELCGMMSRILRCVDVDIDSLAVDVINRVGPQGHYLTQKHTLERFSKEICELRLSDKKTWDQWVRAGSRNVTDVAREKALEILRDHHPEPLDEDVQKELARFLEVVKKRIEIQSMKT